MFIKKFLFSILCFFTFIKNTPEDLHEPKMHSNLQDYLEKLENPNISLIHKLELSERDFIILSKEEISHAKQLLKKYIQHLQFIYHPDKHRHNNTPDYQNTITKISQNLNVLSSLFSRKYEYLINNNDLTQFLAQTLNNQIPTVDLDQIKFDFDRLMQEDGYTVFDLSSQVLLNQDFSNAQDLIQKKIEILAAYYNELLSKYCPETNNPEINKRIEEFRTYIDTKIKEKYTKFINQFSKDFLNQKYPQYRTIQSKFKKEMSKDWYTFFEIEQLLNQDIRYDTILERIKYRANEILLMYEFILENSLNDSKDSFILTYIQQLKLHFKDQIMKKIDTLIEQFHKNYFKYYQNKKLSQSKKSDLKS